MASPPFPVPRGMEWDPGKKRFFKAPPAKANVAPKRVPPAPPLEKCLARQQPIRPCRLAQSRIPPSSFALASRATRPTLGASKRMRREVSQCALGGARHVATTTLIPWAQRGWRGSAPDPSTSWSVGIRTLFCPRELGSLLYFSNGSGSLFLLDTAHITRREYSCALAHFFDYLPLALPHQTQPTLDVDWSTIMCVSDLQMPTQNSASPCLSSVTNNRMATIVGDELVVYRTGAKTGRNHHAVVLSKLKVAKDPIRILCVRECKGGRSTVLAYATQRQFGVYRFGSAGKPDTIAFQRMESDIICLDIFPSATTVLVGLRNGRIVQHSTKQCLKRTAKEAWRSAAPPERSAAALKAGEGVAFASLGPGLTFPVPGRGAVTNLLAVSNGEVLVAYSSGQLFLVSADRPEDPLLQFEGHVNSWSLDLVSVPCCARLRFVLTQSPSLLHLTLCTGSLPRQDRTGECVCGRWTTPFRFAPTRKQTTSRLAFLTWPRVISAPLLSTRRSLRLPSAASPFASVAAWPIARQTSTKATSRETCPALPFPAMGARLASLSERAVERL